MKLKEKGIKSANKAESQQYLFQKGLWRVVNLLNTTYFGNNSDNKKKIKSYL